MKVDVRPFHIKGKPLSTKERAKLPFITGKLKVFDNRQHKLGRVVKVACLVSTTDDLESLLMPELFDVSLLWVDEGFIRLRGFEVIDDYEHSQAWEIKVL
jgi:hypothetical protein